MEYNFLMSTQLTSRRYPKLKEVDDVLGGAAAWDNVDKTKSELLNSFELLLSAVVLLCVCVCVLSLIHISEPTRRS